MLRALFSGVSGLNQNVIRLDVIGNNIANVNTVGFKTARVSFGDAFSQTLRGGTVARSNRGGVNPIQVGSGVRVHAITSMFNQGNIQTTGGSTDLAIQGDGFFIVNNGEENFYSRAGTLTIDSLGRVVQAGTGYIAQGFAWNSQTDSLESSLGELSVPFDKTVPAQATETISMQGNLPLDSEAQASILQTGDLTDSTGAAILPTTLLSELRQDGVPGTQLLFDTDEITLNAQVGGGTTTATLTVGAATTVADLLSFVDTTLSLPAGSATVVDGRVVVTGDVSIGEAGRIGAINLSATDTTGTTPRSEFEAALGFVTTQDARDPSDFVMEQVIYDSLGEAHTLGMTFTRQTGSLAWDWTATLDGDTTGVLAGGSGSVTFFPNGTLASFSFSDGSTSMTIDPGTGAVSPQVVELDHGPLGDAGGMTLLAGTGTLESKQDGFPVGNFVDFAIDGSGRIFTVFSNGETEIVGDLALARFNNPTSLVKDGDNLYTISSNSGDPAIRRASEMAGTSMIVGALEQSNVDLAREFSEMIITQRAFQANARVIQTSSDILAELMQLTR